MSRLLDAKAEPDDPEPKTGWTPLLRAARYGHSGAVELLLARKAP